jgi:hypothetical protein
MITVRAINGHPMIFIASLDGIDVGRAEVTIVPVVHDMDITATTLQRKVAEALFQYMSGFVKASGFGEAIAMVEPENLKMQTWLEARAVPASWVKPYTVTIP